MVELGGVRRARVRAALLLLVALASACGGGSVRESGRAGDTRGQGGSTAGTGSEPMGGVVTGGTGFGGDGSAAGGSFGGTSTTGGIGAGGSSMTGGSSSGGTSTAGVGGTSGSAGYGWDTCPEFGQTTISGTVFAPSGVLPLYNVLIYVPRGSPPPIADGISCDRCNTPAPMAESASLSDARGHFTIAVPSGHDVPVVLQIGRWRRELTLPVVRPCVDNAYDEEGFFRLPRSQVEGHLPKLAVTTGAEDALECLLRRIGIDDSEFTNDAGGGRVNLFRSCDGGSGTGTSSLSDQLGGAMLSSATTLFSSPTLLGRYDYILLGCEGDPCASDKQPNLANIQRYADLGGRLMLDHLQRYWLENGSTAWRNVAEFSPAPPTLPDALPARIDNQFPKGQAFAEWLVNVGASTRLAELPLFGAHASMLTVTPPAQRWLYADALPNSEDGHAILTMTVNTPVDAPVEQTCGRVTFMDFHAFSPEGEVSQSDVPFPLGCHDGPLSPQEAAFAFQLFDISACVVSDIIDPPRW